MVAFREITTGLRFPEGPIAMPDGVVVLVEIEGRRLTRVHPDGRKEVICETGGGPNGAAAAAALKHLHQQDLIHRDLKPERLMLDG